MNDQRNFSLSRKELIRFTKKLGFLLKAGLPLKDCISLLESQAKKIPKKIYHQVFLDIADGLHLYQSLERFPKAFNNLTTSLVRSGEESGLLAENIENLSAELYKRQQFQQKAVGAFVYPLFIAGATFLLSGFLLFFIFPKIEPLFKTMSVPLPWSTRCVLFISSFLKRFGIFTLIFIILALSFCSIKVRKNKKWRDRLDYYLISIPVIGILIKKYQLYLLTQTLGTMLKGGSTIDYSLQTITSMPWNTRYAHVLIILKNEVMNGKNLSTSMECYPDLFPSIVSDMTMTGEIAGTLADSLLYISIIYQQELDETIKTISSLLEPILMIVMGFIVGFISLSIITPLYAITQNIKH